MSAMNRYIVLAACVLACVLSTESLTTVLVFDAEDRNRSAESCIAVLKSAGVTVRPYFVNPGGSVEDTRSDVCTRMAESDHLAMILDYSRVQAVNSLLDGLSQQLHVPHLRMGSGVQPEFGGHDFQLQVHPGALLQLLLLKNFLRKEQKEDRWQDGVVVLLSKRSESRNLLALFENANQPLVIRRWKAVMEENSRMVEDVSRKSAKNFIIALVPEKLNDFFVLMSSKGMLTFAHNYLLVHPEASSVDLSTFAYSRANIVAFRPKLGTNPAPMLAKLTVIAKDLAASLKASLPVNWRPRCSGEAWSDGRKTMDIILRNAEASYGLVKQQQDLMCPAINHQFLVDSLTESGYARFLSWREGEGFKNVANALSRQKRQSLTTLRAVVVVNPPYVIRKDDGTFFGMAIDIADEAAKIAGYKLEYELSADGRFGRQIGVRWDGMVGQLVRKEVDIAVGSISITYNRERDIDFTMAWKTIGIIPIMTKSKPLDIIASNTYAFINGFSVRFWVLILSLIITSLVLFVVARLSPMEWHHTNPTTKVNQFTLCNAFWFVASTALFRSSNLSPRAKGTRVISLVWWEFTLLIIIVFVLSVQNSMQMSKENKEVTFNNIEDLLKQPDIKFGMLYGGSTYGFFKRNVFPTFKAIFEKVEQDKDNSYVNSISDGIQRVLSTENFVFFMESTTAVYYAARNCKLTVVGDRLNSVGYGFGFQKDSQYRNAFNEALLMLKERYTIDRIVRKYLYRYNNTNEPCVTADEKTILENSNIYVFGVLFIGLLIGLLIGIVIIILELLIRACRAKDRGQRTCFEYLGHRLRLLFCACNGKDIHEKKDEESQELT